MSKKDYDFVSSLGNRAGINDKGQMWSVHVKEDRIVSTTHISECAIRVEVWFADGRHTTDTLRSL